MSHLGLTPQSVHQLGGFKAQGRSADVARRLLEDAGAALRVIGNMIFRDNAWRVGYFMVKGVNDATSN